RHLRNLPRHKAEGQLFPLKQLLALNDYPQPQYVPAFYAQSVSVVEFLAKEKGPQVVTQFVRDGLRQGYESALQKHYGLSFAELEARWRSATFNEPDTGMAERRR